MGIRTGTAMLTEPALLSSESVLLRLLQLSCPSLPIGAYAYSQGIEQAAERGWVTSEGTALEWIGGLLDTSVCQLDVPLLVRMHRAWSQGRQHDAWRYNDVLLASRESREIQEEELHLGSALARVLPEIGVPIDAAWLRRRPTYLGMFALAATHFGAAERATATAYAFAWAEHQVSAVTRILPLGQMASQRVLSSVLGQVPSAVERGLACDDDDIGFLAPALAMASGWHETQYTRLFRS